MTSTEKDIINSSRVGKVSIKDLFGDLDYSILLNTEERITIAYGPNGIGKTTLLRMLNTLFKSNFSYLSRTPFTELDVEFLDGSNLSVTRSIKEEKARIKVSYSTGDNVGKSRSFEVDIDALSKPEGRNFAGYIERYVPHLLQVGPETWLDRRTNRHLTLDELIEEFGDSIPQKIQARTFKVPDWFRRMTNSTNFRLIETQRLFYLERAYFSL